MIFKNHFDVIALYLFLTSILYYYYREFNDFFYLLYDERHEKYIKFCPIKKCQYGTERDKNMTYGHKINLNFVLLNKLSMSLKK